MAEAHSPGDPLSPSMASGAAAPHPAVASTHALVPATLNLDPPPSGVSVGLPIINVPPMVEPLDVDRPAAEIRPPGPVRRPVRRRFLPPTPQPVANGHDRLLPGTAPERILHQAPQRQQRTTRSEFDDVSTRSERLSPVTQGRDPEKGPPSAAWSWRRPLLTGAGVAAALALAVGVEFGNSGDWLATLRAAIPHRGVAASSAPNAAGPRSEQEPRVREYTARAKAGDADAQVALAVLYAKGDGVAQDYATAAAWFRRAAEKGVSRAQYDLGVLFERGRGVPHDYAQAVAWYRKAAEQNHPLAQYNLAVAFTKGGGVRRDPIEAAVWYHRAAAQGVVAAMVNLAILYERGEGVDASTTDAYAWYRAAAKRGSAAAARRADELLQAFSPSEQTQAEAKTADVAASIRDAAGERARLSAKNPLATPAAAGPAQKTGGESEKTSPPAAAYGADNP